MERDLRLRPLGAPFSVRVKMDRAGEPVEVRNRKGGKARRVVAIREVWQIDDEWWRRPISRLYYQVVLENGGILTLYLDLIEGGWWTQ